MSERSKPTVPTPISRAYKRSWRNLLINKKYQLRFTLFMAGMAGVLIAGLGYFVMFYADRTTRIGINRVISEPCPEVPTIDTTPAPVAPVKTPGPATDPDPVVDDGDDDDAGSGADAADPRKSKITMGESSIQTCDDPDPANRPPNCPVVAPPKPVAAPADFANEAAAHWACEMRHDGAVIGLQNGRTQILLVLIGTGLLLVLGLAAYGIKMTHRVAGPLYKVQLYLAKMRDGRLDKVWNLRKGDQLVQFYEHFKAGHAGVVAMEQADIARLKSLLAVIDRDPTKFSTPELAERVGELRAMLARKEKSVE